MGVMENNYKSSEELYMSWWLEDALNHGLILDWSYEADTFILCDDIKIICLKPKKTKKGGTDVTDKKLLEQQTYTPDFRFTWNESMLNILFKRYDRFITDSEPFFYAKDINGQLTSVIDVKPGYGQSQASTVRFPVKQAWMYQQHGIYVQKVITVNSIKHKLGRRYNGLFPDTFVPERYLRTDKSEAKRVINFDYKLINAYV